ncbi:MAG: tetratricopeptide repeat protein [Nanoarchaeota archaeon]|nr:tetratricopeptide repeat protein [Nanoarchaeota archaeon]
MTLEDELRRRIEDIIQQEAVQAEDCPVRHDVDYASLLERVNGIGTADKQTQYEVLSEVIGLDPDFAYGLYKMGDLYEKSGMLDWALHFYGRAADNDKGYLPHKARVQARSGDRAGALATIDDIQAGWDEGYHKSLELAMICHKLGMHDEALQHVDRSLAHWPEYEAGWIHKADILEATGEHKWAIDSLERCSQLRGGMSSYFAERIKMIRERM